MILANRGSVFRLLRWQWKWVCWFIFTSSVITVAHNFLRWHWMHMPTLPLVVTGAALGIFVSFRTNSAYDRWWEGRKLWGRLVNASRRFASQVVNYLPGSANAPTEIQKKLIQTHILYVHLLRVILRRQDPTRDTAITELTTAREIDYLVSQTNATHALLDQQVREIATLADNGSLSEFRLQAMDSTIAELLDVQGGCERIKNTPMPRGYGFIATRLTLIYAAVFPFGIVHDLSWATIPLNVLVCLSFGLISEAGRVLEDPFTMYWNALPLTQLSRMIEANLRQRIGDTTPVQIPVPDSKGILY